MNLTLWFWSPQKLVLKVLYFLLCFGQAIGLAGREAGRVPTGPFLRAGEEVLFPGEVQVSWGVASSSSGIWNGCPESPDGTKVAYAVYPQILDNTKRLNYPAELWVCDRTNIGTFVNHRRVLSGVRDSPHYGLMQTWITEKLLAYSGVSCGIIDIERGQHVLGPFDNLSFGHRAHGTKLLLETHRCRPEDFQKLRELHGIDLRHGISEIDIETGQVRCILPMERLLEQRAAIEKHTPLDPDPGKWICNHLDYSPDGRRILFCFLGGRGTLEEFPQLTMFVDRDGSNLTVAEITPRIHTGWFSNGLLLSGMLVHPDWNSETWDFAGATNGALPRSAEELAAARNSHDCKGSILSTVPGLNPVAVLAGPANHIAKSPDGTLIAGEIIVRAPREPYQLNLYLFGQVKPAVTVFRTHFKEVVYGAACHADPSFSRDGKRLYYNRPVGPNTARMFCYTIPDEVLEQAAALKPKVERLIARHP